MRRPDTYCSPCSEIHLNHCRGGIVAIHASRPRQFISKNLPQNRDARANLLWGQLRETQAQCARRELRHGEVLSRKIGDVAAFDSRKPFTSIERFRQTDPQAHSAMRPRKLSARWKIALTG